MGKKIYGSILLVFILAASSLVGGCSNPIKAGKPDMHEVVDRVDKENKELKDEIKQLQEKNQELNEEIEKIVKPQEEEVKVEETIFAIYGADIDTYEQEEIGEITIEDRLSLEDKLEEIGEELSRLQFEGLGIELEEIVEEEGKQVAIINLTEKSNPEELTWIGNYFQGSAGGTITTVSLDETFLQKEYEGEWIDGVKFLYNGEEIVFDHVESLSQVSYR